jgi:hypothetical protein
MSFRVSGCVVAIPSAPVEVYYLSPLIVDDDVGTPQVAENDILLVKCVYCSPDVCEDGGRKGTLPEELMRKRSRQVLHHNQVRSSV